jgi:hypothetical protein
MREKEREAERERGYVLLRLCCSLLWLVEARACKHLTRAHLHTLAQRRGWLSLPRSKKEEMKVAATGVKVLSRRCLTIPSFALAMPLPSGN